jgi:peroxiredoxin
MSSPSSFSRSRLMSSARASSSFPVQGADRKTDMRKDGGFASMVFQLCAGFSRVGKCTAGRWDPASQPVSEDARRVRLAARCYVATIIGFGLPAALLLGVAASSASAKQPQAVAFFNQYCVSCRQEAPRVVSWARHMARSHYAVSGVGFRETTSDARSFARSIHFRYPVVGDPSGKIARRYGVGVPTIVVTIDRRGHAVLQDYSKWKTRRAAMLRSYTPTCRHGFVRKAVFVRRHGRRVKVEKCVRRPKRHRNPTRSHPTTPLAVHPVFVSSFNWQSSLGQERYILVRYLRLSGDAGTNGESNDAAFAHGATGPSRPIIALPVTCGQRSTITAALRAARIPDPVIVDTNLACTSQLNASLDGITTSTSGQERLFRSDGQPLASQLVVGADFAAYNSAHPGSPVQIADWMGGLPNPGDLYGIYGASVLDVPIPPNVHLTRNLNFTAGQSELAVRGFWYVCPSCVASMSDYQLEGWGTMHPSAPVAAFTCDANENEAADWAYEHGWTFPVYVYDGTLDFATCFDQIGTAQLGFSWYGDTAYLQGGSLAGGLPDYSDLPTG